MLKIDDKSNCCGCEVCTNVCPKKCISMNQDEYGFYYPSIDSRLCVDCGLCEKVCPFLNQPVNNGRFAYAAQSKDETILYKSASGGACTTISKYVIENGGISVGASYLKKTIMHTIVDNAKDATSHSSSKYVQSRMYNIYSEVKKNIETGKVVLFSGTPCQVNALKNFIGKDYDNLYTIDLVCSGVSSPKVFDEYIKIMENENSDISYINFKYKKYGYHSSVMQIKFDNGNVYERSRLTDYMANVYTSYIAMRPSCYNCKAKGKNRSSDLTVFDCWHYSELTGMTDNNLGFTNIIINTDKGNNILEDCKSEFNLFRIDKEKAILLDGNAYDCSIKPNPNSESFYNYFNKFGLIKALIKCGNINCLSYIKEFAKPILYKLKLLNIVKRVFGISRC